MPHPHQPRRPAPGNRRRAAAFLVAAGAAALTAAATATGAPAATGPAPSNPAATGVPPWDVNTATGAVPAGGMYEVFAPDGGISLRRGGPDHAPQPLAAPRRAGADGAEPALTPMHRAGDPGNRVNLVFVGDGYTAAEQGVFEASAEQAWRALMTYEPYKTYQNFFDGWRVDVPSPVSGISNDPVNGVERPTPLGMHFWCHAIERLLCVDTAEASSYASLLSAPSHVIALAHTNRYGGAGGSVTTLAGENPDSRQVIVHEMAHTLAGLGDEYTGSYDVVNPYAPPPASDDRVAGVMRQNRMKWYRWLGKPSADGGVVGAYEGSNYSATGYYRPSANSEMRTLGRQFNPPSVEALIESFYVARGTRKAVDPIDSAVPAPSGAGITERNTKLSVTLIPLVGAPPYRVSWGVDGTEVPGSAGATSLDLATAPLVKGRWNQVSVYVVDENPAVADEDFRVRNMTRTRLWWVWGG